MNKKVVLIGEKKSENLGDSVICRVAETLITKYYPSLNIPLFDISIAKRPESIIGKKLNNLFSNSYLNKQYLYLYTFVYYYKVIEYNTHVCFVGGALVQDFFADALVAIIDVCRIKEAKLHFCGLGMGDLSLRNENRIKSTLLKVKNKDLKLRDGILYFSAKIDPRCQFIPDIAICCPYVYGDIENGGKYIGLGVISPDNISSNHFYVSKDYYIRECQRCIHTLTHIGIKVALFTNGDRGDYSVAKEIYSFFSKSDRVLLLDRPTKDAELLNFYKNFKYIISSRLHSLIIAYGYEIPTLALSWDNKVNEFVEYARGSSAIYEVCQMHTINWEDEITKLNHFNFCKNRLIKLRKQVFDNINAIFIDDSKDNTLLLVK